MQNPPDAQPSSHLARVAAAAFRRRRAAGLALADQTEALTQICYAMARRFYHGGKLITFGTGANSTDASHLAVEFVHPVIVGKRALPALALTADVATMMSVANRMGWDEVFSYQLKCLARPQDIALGISQDDRCWNVLRGLQSAKTKGLLTVALVGEALSPIAVSPAVDHILSVGIAEPRLSKELQVSLYHILWELVHVFLEQPGILTPEGAS